MLVLLSVPQIPFVEVQVADNVLTVSVSATLRMQAIGVSNVQKDSMEKVVLSSALEIKLALDTAAVLLLSMDASASVVGLVKIAHLH